MLLYNWMKCLEGKFQYARIKASDKDEITEADKLAFDVIHDDYLDNAGINDSYKRLVEMKVKIAKAQADYMIQKEANDPRYKQNLNTIRVFSSKAEQLKAQMGNGMTIKAVLVHLGKWNNGKPLNPKEITVSQYLDYLNEFEASNKAS